ncbi:MAG: endonuclease/exonuclease/phosphatase family protein [Clostridia bacterium]|nr:endonuclease/exonuclease/phosphatase family protein [Clostridia bacterium]
MKIATFNIRCKFDGDGINSFVHRAGFIFHKINMEKPDIIAFQEVTEPILDMLEKMLTDYIIVGQFRSKNYDEEGLFTAIRKESLQLLGLETIWLSPTPFVPGSRYEDQSTCPRVLVQTTLRDRKSGLVFRLFNIHLDHISEHARVEGMEAAIGYINEFQNKNWLPFMLMGDFNALPDSEVITMCNAYEGIKDVTSHIPFTYHEWGVKNNKIDYIYMTDDLAEKVKKVTAWDDKINGIWLSDHYPVCAEMEL